MKKPKYRKNVGGKRHPRRTSRLQKKFWTYIYRRRKGSVITLIPRTF